MKFRAGDKVQRLQGTLTEGGFLFACKRRGLDPLNTVFTVTSSGQKFLSLEGLSGGWYVSCFKYVVVPEIDLDEFL